LEQGVGMATYHQIAIGRLDRLSSGLGLEAHHGRFRALVSYLFKGWGDVPVPEQAPYASALTNDHSPFEYSLAFADMSVDLSLVTEVQAPSPSLIANRTAALAFNDRLLPFGVDFERFRRVSELFLPATPEPPFSLWHGLTLRPGSVAGFKLILNPAASGAARALETVREALARLDVKNANPTLEKLLRRGEGLDELAYVSIDLSTGPGAEVRVYVRHLAATAADLEKTSSLFPAHRAGDAIGLCRAVVKGAGAFARNPPLTSVAFGHGSAAPSAAAMDVFIAADGGSDDADMSARIGLYLSSLNLDANRYAKALAGFATRSLSRGPGVQSRVSFTRDAYGPRVGINLCPEVFRTPAVGASQTRLKGDPAGEVPAGAPGGEPTLPAVPVRTGSGQNVIGDGPGGTGTPSSAARSGKKAG
jgi:hypothetical protein